MTRTKHVFRQDVPCLTYAALGDTAARVIAIHHAIDQYELDAVIVPQRNPALHPLWFAVFGKERVVTNPNAIPASHSHARMSAPTQLDWWYGSAGWNVFESVLWENGFFDTKRLRITPPNIFPCNPSASAVMIYPAEVTDGNRVFDAQWWISTCQVFKQRGYALNHLGDSSHPSLSELYASVSFDQKFPPTIEGLRACIGASSLAIGASTGPTWVCLLSDIRQIVLESRKSPHGYWHFDRCQTVLTKRLEIMATLESCLSRLQL